MKKIFIIILIINLFYACTDTKQDIDTSGIKLEINIKRLDTDLIKNYPDTPNVSKLMLEYAKFFDLYSYKVLQIGDPKHKQAKKLLNDFNNYCFDYELPQKINKQFGDLSELRQDLELAFKHYKYYFPNSHIPQIYTYISNFSQSVVVDDSILGIGLDKYLGAQCKLYSRLGFDNYKRRRMTPEMITVDCMRAMLISEFPYKDETNDNLLNRMVYEGKIQYCLDAMMPLTSDTLKFGYTEKQLNWAENNESNMWTYLIDHQHLFSTDALTIRGMIGEAPFTSMFSNNSAPRAGAFLGWKIVSKYMEEYPKTSILQLMQNSDYQLILNKAKYKP